MTKIKRGLCVTAKCEGYQNNDSKTELSENLHSR